MKARMGETHFKLDNSTDTREALLEFFKQNGFEIEDMITTRPTYMTHKDGLQVKLYWFRNLCHIQVGHGGGAVIEGSFDEIQGSFMPWCDHETYDFKLNSNTTVKLAIRRRQE